MSMRSESQVAVGVLMILGGLVLLYLLRGVFYTLIVLVLGFVGVIIGLLLFLGGIAMIVFSGRRRW